MRRAVLIFALFTFSQVQKTSAQVGGCTFPTFTFTSCFSPNILCNYQVCVVLTPLNNPGCPNQSCVFYPCITFNAGSCNETKSIVPVDLHCPNSPCPLEGCYKMQLVVNMVTSTGVFISQAAAISLYDPTVGPTYRFLNSNNTWSGKTNWSGISQTPQQSFTNCFGEIESYITLQTANGFDYTICDPFLL